MSVLPTLFTSSQNKRPADKAFNQHRPVDQSGFPIPDTLHDFVCRWQNLVMPVLPLTHKMALVCRYVYYIGKELASMLFLLAILFRDTSFLKTFIDQPMPY